MASYQNWIILLLFAFCLQTKAQDVKFSYQSKIGTSNIDTILVWARSNTISSVSLTAVNFSWVYSSSCLTYVPGNNPNPNSFWSLFRDTWGSFLESDQLFNVMTTYGGNSYDRRVQYGNAMAFSNPVVMPPNTQAPILVMKLWFSGSCASQVYMENESENGFNQIADAGGVRTYIIENLLSQPLEAGIWASVNVTSSNPESAVITWSPQPDMVDGHFSVERSTSPNFIEVDTRTHIFTQLARSSYAYEDNLPLAGLSYYRIRYTDASGHEEISRVVSIYLETDELKDPIRIIPNPSSGDFQLNFLLSGEPVNVQLLDMQGRMVWKHQQQFEGSIPISLSFLPAGPYQFIITQQDGRQWYKKVLIK